MLNSTPKFLLVAPREDDQAGAAEYLDFLEVSGLDRSQLDRVKLTNHSHQLPDLSQYAGIMVGGSEYNVSDPDPSGEHQYVQDQIRSLIAGPTPLLIACYGAGLAAGSVTREIREPAGVSLVQLTEAAADDPLLDGVADEFWACTGHNDTIEELGEGNVLLATGPTCPIQMFRHGDHVWATQFHSELTGDGLVRRMEFYRNGKYFSNEEFDEIAREVRSHDYTPTISILRNFVAFASTYSA